MTAFGGLSVGASLPWFLFGIPIGVFALWYIFRRKGHQKPRIISSLFLLRQLPQIESRQKTFIPPLQFWLEVALITAVIALISNVYIKDTRRTIAVLLDVSKSMSALHGEGESRLDTAKRYAKSDMLATDTDVRFVIYSADDSLRPIGKDALGSFHSRSEAIRSVELVTQSYREDSLQRIIDELRQNSGLDEIWVYTDKQSDSPSKQGRMQVTTIPAASAGLGNVWISSAEIVSASTNSVPLVDVDIRHVGLEGQSGSVRLTCYSGRDKAIVASDVTRLTRLKKEVKTIRLSLPKDGWRYCYLEVSLSPSSVRDSLVNDNRVWLVNSEEQRVVYVTSPLSVEALKIDKILPYRFRTFSPEDVHPTHSAIFHRVAPPKSFYRNFLSIVPPQGLKLEPTSVGTRQVPGMARLTRWIESHPIMRYVRPGAMRLPNPYVLKCPWGSEGVMFVEQGAVMCVGQRGVSRYVITGFELFPFDGNQNRALSILTLNIFKYLFAEKEPADDVNFPTTRIEAVHADGMQVDGGAVTFPIVSAGVYRVFNKGDKNGTLKAINLISNRESNLIDIEKVSVDSLEGESKRDPHTIIEASSSSDPSAEHFFLLAALIACFSDIALRIVKRTSWRGR